MSAAFVSMAEGVSVYVAATAWIGAGISVAGYMMHDPLLTSIGGVMLGFAGGYCMPGAGGMNGAVLGASVSGACSPISPLDKSVKEAVGWAYTAYGIVNSLSQSAYSGKEGNALADGESTPNNCVDDDPLFYDGKRLTATDSNGNELSSWEATSGRPGSTTYLEDQAKRSYGPIPEGEYSVNPEKIQRWNDLPFEQKAAAYVKRGEWPGGIPVWGDTRVPIDIPGGSILGRDNFFIHGGWFPGSAGCIDLGSYAGNFFNYLSAQKGPIPLTVRYGY